MSHYQNIKNKQHNIQAHNLTCSLNCDFYSHEEKGFSSILFNIFNDKNDNFSLDDKIMTYIKKYQSFT